MAYKNLLSKKRKFIELIKTSPYNKPSSSSIISSLGISKATYYRWSRDKEFKNLIAKETGQDIEVFLPDVREILLKKALQGDMNAVKLFLQRYDNQDTIDDDEELTPDKIMEIITCANSLNEFPYSIEKENNKGEIEVIWIDEETHNRGVEIFIERKEPKDLSFFDCVDFALIERYSINKAFSFDKHFKFLKIPILGMG